MKAPPNNGMHPTANSAALMRETPPNQRFVAAGDAGRWAATARDGMREMGRDPLERERDFRSAIEQSALARRRSRGLRPWLRALLSLFRPRLLLALALMSFVGFFVFIFGLFAKWTDAYACSLEVARRSPVVVAELGEPVEAGFFAWSYGYSREGSVTDTAFRTNLAGPKGEGTLRVQWYSSPVGSSLRVELEKGGRTHLVYGGAIPCR